MYTSLAGIQIGETPELTKRDIRKKVWEYIEKNKLTQYASRVFNQIPNFIGADKCAQKLEELPEFNAAETVKVDPDKPLEDVRFLTLQSGKNLLVPVPRLGSGLFSILQKDENDDEKMLRFKSQAKGIRMKSKPFGLDDRKDVDIMVLGSVAVSRTGKRLGKGEGFSDLEFGFLKMMECIDDSLKVITIVHDCQVFDDLPSRLFREYDIPVDVIITPDEIIEVSSAAERPMGIYWNLLNSEKFLQIPALRDAYETALSNGEEVQLKDGVILPDKEEVEKYEKERRFRSDRGGGGRGGYGWNWPRFGNRGGPRDNYGNRRFMMFSRNGGGRVRGRFRRGEEGSVNQVAEEVAGNIQVTINMDEENKVVSRKVESLDGEGGAISSIDKSPPTFTIFVGGIPKFCRLYELEVKLKHLEIRPSYITWKGHNGFAFLNFHEDPSREEEILSALQDLVIRNRKLTVAKAKRKVAENEAGGSVESEETECSNQPPQPPTTSEPPSLDISTWSEEAGARGRTNLEQGASAAEENCEEATWGTPTEESVETNWGTPNYAEGASWGQTN